MIGAAGWYAGLSAGAIMLGVLYFACTEKGERVHIHVSVPSLAIPPIPKWVITDIRYIWHSVRRHKGKREYWTVAGIEWDIPRYEAARKESYA